MSMIPIFLSWLIFLFSPLRWISKPKKEWSLTGESVIFVSGHIFRYFVVLTKHPYYKNYLLTEQIGICMKDEIDRAGFVCKQSQWCNQKVGESNWVFHQGRFYFKKRSDAEMFLWMWV
jgi:hypothetical protein